MLEHVSLASWYQINTVLKLEHNFTLTEIENMFPYERDAYIMLINQHLEKKKQQQENGK